MSTSTLLPQLTHDAFLAQAAARFGPDPMNWRFVCPSCGHVASVADWKKAGAPETAVAFSCIGRWTGSKQTMCSKEGGPCNYAGGGLFQLNPQPVLREDGKVAHYFALAEG